MGNYLQSDGQLRPTTQGPGQSASAATANAVNAATTTPIHRYDSNGDGRIQRSEVLDAIDDYQFGGTASRSDVLDLIDLYQFG